MSEQKLLILGNGFDLACGLRSRYSDFYKACIKGKYNINDSSNVKDFWQKLLCCYDNGSNDYNWCDIEGIILDTLKEVEKSYDEIKIYDDNEDLIGKQYDLLHPINKTKDSFFNACLGELVLYDHCDVNKIFDNLLSKLHSLERQFCKYMRGQVTDNYIKYIEKASEIIWTKFPSYTPPEQEAVETYIFDFNYTVPLKDTDRTKDKQHNLHGKICENNCTDCEYENSTGSPIIFGIDDREVLDDDNLKLFSKTYRKLMNYEKSDKHESLPSRENDTTICFFGHSLSKAEYSYFQAMFDYYNLYDNGKVNLVFYYNPFKQGVAEETADAVYKLINEYGATMTNKDQGHNLMHNLMHKLMLENRIHITELKVKEIFAKAGLEKC